MELCISLAHVGVPGKAAPGPPTFQDAEHLHELHQQPLQGFLMVPWLPGVQQDATGAQHCRQPNAWYGTAQALREEASALIGGACS